MMSSLSAGAPAQRAAVRARGPQRAALRVNAVATATKKDATASAKVGGGGL